jgi:tetratricopeptide (TPR) repeat protein
MAERNLISLGHRCDVAFQLRMHGAENIAHFFDWLSTPFDGLIKILSANFEVFAPDHLVLNITQSPNYVSCQVTGVDFYHQFPLFDGHVQPDFLLFYKPFIEKFRYLAERFRNYLSEHQVTLVRQDTTLSQAQAQALEDLVIEKFRPRDARFLYVLNEAYEEFETAHGRARILRAPWSSVGDPGTWSKFLAEEGLAVSPYRRATIDILGGHDDYNLIPDDRFSETQLLDMIAANPRSVAYPLELSRFYISRGMVAQAADAAIAALARNPADVNAAAHAARAQFWLGRIPPAEAAASFLRAGPDWGPEAAGALCDDARPIEGLAVASAYVAYEPLNHRGYYAKARCLAATGQYSLAALAINMAMRLNSNPDDYGGLQKEINTKLSQINEVDQPPV